jgi:RNA polymerase sigma-70 factor (ECF subfamily)
MSLASRDEVLSLERYRSYLYVVARLRLQGQHDGRIDPADMVQQTLLEAHQQRQRFQGTTPAEMTAWLRRILAHNLGDAFRALHRECRDVRRERPLHAAGGPEGALAAVLAAPGDSPGEQAAAHESAARLADALLRLPEAQREALVLQYWHGMTLAEIAGRLERTPVAVAGLLRRGLVRLRELLAQAS